MAAEAGCDRTVEVLIDAVVDVDQRDARGLTAIEIAERGGHDDVVRRLRAAGATDRVR